MRDDATMCSWCWNSNDESKDINSACGQEQEDQSPAPAPPDTNMADEGNEGTAAWPGVHDRGIPGHVGAEKQLHSETGYNLVVDGEGKVYGTREPYSQEAILQIHSRAAGEVQIKGKNSNLYIAMNETGKVYAENDATAENTWFHEKYEDGWNSYVWMGNSKDWHLGIKKNGKMKRGHRTKRGQSAVKFLPRTAEPSM